MGLIVSSFFSSMHTEINISSINTYVLVRTLYSHIWVILASGTILLVSLTFHYVFLGGKTTERRGPKDFWVDSFFWFHIHLCFFWEESITERRDPKDFWPINPFMVGTNSMILQSNNLAKLVDLFRGKRTVF